MDSHAIVLDSIDGGPSYNDLAPSCNRDLKAAVILNEVSGGDEHQERRGRVTLDFARGILCCLKERLFEALPWYHM